MHGIIKQMDIKIKTQIFNNSMYLSSLELQPFLHQTFLFTMCEEKPERISRRD